MNDRRFIELLNLYVDQELSDAEARELEQEIAQRPDRRRVYSQYCRMQRACVRLLEQQAAPAPRLAEIREAGSMVERVEPATVINLTELPAPRRRRMGWAAWSGGLAAAAACVAVGLVALRQPSGVPGSTGPSSIAAAPQPAAAVAVAANETQPAATSPTSEKADAESTREYRPVLTFTGLARSSDNPFGQNPNPASLQPRLDWLQEYRLTPIRQLSLDPMPYQPVNSLQAAEAGQNQDRMDHSMPAHLITFEFRR